MDMDPRLVWLIVILLALVGLHLQMRSFFTARALSKSSKMYDKYTGQGYANIKQPTEEQFRSGEREFVYIKGPSHRFTYNPGRWTVRHTMIFFGLPALGAYIWWLFT